MFIFQMRRAVVDEGQVSRFAEFLRAVPEQYRGLIHPALEFQSDVFNISVPLVRRVLPERSYRYERTPYVVEDGEVFTNDGDIFVVYLRRRLVGVRLPPFGVTENDAEHDRIKTEVVLVSIAKEVSPSGLGFFETLIQENMGVNLETVHFQSERFDELRAEGREVPSPPNEAELRAAEILSDRATRTLAVAVKASGGLLVQDLPRQLPAESRGRVGEIQSRLLDGKLIDSETVVVCSKTQAQTARGPSKEFILGLSKRGLKCACGRPIGEERIEEALTITDRGRLLLDKSRWMTVLLLEEFRQVGILPENVLIDQQMGGDEVDCLANVNGELVLFELKDKEFSLGNAYSFGAKIGIIRPEHAVILTTEVVGNDAKEHFERSRLAQRSRHVRWDLEEETTKVLYIEGTDALRTEVRDLIGRIYAQDAVRELNQVLPLVSLDAQALLGVLGENERRLPNGLLEIATSVDDC